MQDYVGKNGFPSVILGLSGGIDSALTLALAVDALGADRVRAVMMPSAYTADISLDDAREHGAAASAFATTSGRSPNASRPFAARSPTSSAACRKTPPRRTSRHASAARC